MNGSEAHPTEQIKGNKTLGEGKMFLAISSEIRLSGEHSSSQPRTGGGKIEFAGYFSLVSRLSLTRLTGGLPVLYALC